VQKKPHLSERVKFTFREKGGRYYQQKVRGVTIIGKKVKQTRTDFVIRKRGERTLDTDLTQVRKGASGEWDHVLTGNKQRVQRRKGFSSERGGLQKRPYSFPKGESPYEQSKLLCGPWVRGGNK